MIKTDEYISRLEFERRVSSGEMEWGAMQWAGPSPGANWSDANFYRGRPSVASIIDVFGRGDKKYVMIAQFVSTGMGANGEQWGYVRYDNFIKYDPKWDLPEFGAKAA